MGMTESEISNEKSNESENSLKTRLKLATLQLIASEGDKNEIHRLVCGNWRFPQRHGTCRT